MPHKDKPKAGKTSKSGGSSHTRSSGGKDTRATCLKCSHKVGYRTITDSFGSDRVYSKFCGAHTCKAHIPQTIFENFCEKSKDPNLSLCRDHMLCNHAGCPQVGENPSRALPYFCPNHQCVYSVCIKPRVPLSDACKDHQTCASPGCAYLAHTRRGVPFCEVHSCKAQNCKIAAYDLNGLCYIHLPCTINRCMASRMPVDGDVTLLQPFCAKHMPCGGRDCDGFAMEGYRFCERHNCSISKCSNQSESGGSFCKDHTCMSEVCLQSVQKVGHKESLYCSYHSCKHATCFRKAKTPGSYCPGHLCAIAGCPDRHGANGQYCRDHGCQESGCDAEAAVRGGFCRLRGHGCIEKDCNKRAIGGENRIRQCDWHYGEAMRSAGAVRADADRRNEKAAYKTRIEELEKEIERVRIADRRREADRLQRQQEHDLQRRREARRREAEARQEAEVRRELERERARARELEREREREREREQERRARRGVHDHGYRPRDARAWVVDDDDDDDYEDRPRTYRDWNPR